MGIRRISDLEPTYADLLSASLSSSIMEVS